MAVCALLLLPAVAGSGVRCGHVCWGPGCGCTSPPLGEVLLGCAFGRACAPLASALPGGPPVARGSAGVAVGGVCLPPSSLVLFGFWGFVVSFAGCPGLGSRGLSPPIPSLPGRVVCCVCVFFLFFPAWCVSACFECPFSRWAAAFGLVLLVLAGWSPGAPFWGILSSPLSGWGVGPPLVVLVGGVVAVGRSRPPPLPVFFFGGGSACSSLCLPWTGARTGQHSVWFSGLLFVVAFCQAMPRPHGSGGLCTCWARRPFLPG